MKVLFILSSLMYSSYCLAKLSSWDHRAVSELVESYPLRIRNGFVSSMWGTINEPSINFDSESVFKNPVAIIEDWQGESRRFKSGFLKGRLLYWKNKKKSLIRRPLYIIIPGSYSNLSTPQTKRYAYTLFRKGYNVLMLPNPLSLDYLSNAPVNATGDIFEEAEAINEAIGNWLLTEQAKKVSLNSINLVGTSYGGFVAGVLTGSSRSWKSLHKKTFIISAPRYLKKSMELLESYVVNGLKYVSDYRFVEFFKMISKVFMIYMGGPSKNFLDENVLREVQSFVVMHGFQRLFIQSLEYGQRVLGKKTYPKLDDIEDNDTYLHLKKTLRFSLYSKKFLPSVESRLTGQDGDILNWVENEEAENVEVRLLTTRDDWVNPSGIWPKSPAIIELPAGGHFGFRGGVWFDKFMNTLF